jgi:superfamily I DNA/RNA helicase
MNEILTPSKYQQDVYDFVKNEKGNCVINAVAGSGKTTTIIQCLKYIPTNLKVNFLAFNKAIVETLKDRIPSNVKVQTFHSLGCSSIYKTYKNMSKLNDGKIFEYIMSISNRWKMIDKTEINIDYKLKIKNLVALTKLTLANSVADIKEVCLKHQIDATDLDIERVIKVIEETDKDISCFDMNDMVYWPAKYDHFIVEKYDMIFVDECQDLNGAHHKLIDKLSHKTTRLISVGDKNQAIYAFSGADAESFDKLVNRPNTITLPLSVCYRSGKEIVKRAQKIVSHIEPFEHSKDGIVDDNASINAVLEGDMVLCRNTTPLVKLCLEYIHQGKKAYVKGADVGEDLIKIINKSDRKYTDDLKVWLKSELDRIFLSLKKRFPNLDDKEIVEHNSFFIFVEKQKLIETIINDENINLCQNLIVRIREIFLDKMKGGICLSTIHKSKGLENNRVFILDKEKTMPSKYAKLPWQKMQETNLEYVAITRAKDYLGFISDWSFFKD